MRINLFGGPGIGKSTTAAWLFSQLKERHISVEHVGEYVKSWAYQKRKIHKFDQVYIFGKQQQYEYRYISNGVKNIVTDSPCFLSVIYSGYYKSEGISRAISALCAEYDADHPSFNLILDRGNKQYHQEGRWQTEKEAKEIDTLIHRQVLASYPYSSMKIPYTSRDLILEEVLKRIEK